MKICISANSNDLNEAVLDPRFGRCQYFLIIDEKGELIKAIKNPGAETFRGAGILAAQVVAREKVDVVITGNIGPHAFMLLKNLGIKIFLGNFGMSVQEIFKDYQKGKLKEITFDFGKDNYNSHIPFNN